MASVNNAVVVHDLGKSFGKVEALKQVSFSVGRGEVLGLLGPNGAGKTTTVNILSTLTRPDTGYAEVAGYDVESRPAGVRRSIMLTGQHVALDDMLTGRENLLMFGRLRGLRKSQAASRAEELLDQFDLAAAADRGVNTYSGGMRRRIDIACGLVVRPEVVFLDEPTTGLDPRSRQGIWDLVSDFKRAGIATLLTTQYLEEADSLSDRIVVIDHGRVIAEGTADELKERTGATYCEVVPRNLADLDALAETLLPLVSDRRQITRPEDSDRVAIPAPGGPRTLAAVLHHLDVAGIDLADIALRRPSLDEVFLRLTAEPGAGESTARVPVAASRLGPPATPSNGEHPVKPASAAPDQPRRAATARRRPAGVPSPLGSSSGGRHRVGQNGRRATGHLRRGIDDADDFKSVFPGYDDGRDRRHNLGLGEETP